MNRCFSTLHDVIEGGQPCVLVTVAHIAGSAPREPGARMIVTAGEIMGTIGGGNLEYEAIRIARTRLDEPVDTRFIELFALGSMLQQCCGGAVFLHFEVLANGRAEWVAAAAENERNNTRALLVSRTPPSSILRRQEPSAGDSRLRGNDEVLRGNDEVLRGNDEVLRGNDEVLRGNDEVLRGNDEVLRGNGLASTEKMLFTASGATGSLGDNNLEELASAKAATLLASARATETVLLHSLVETQSTLPDITDVLLYEQISPCDFHVVLFGAGHVGRALVNALVEATACRITWVDSRAGQFPENLPHNVEPRFSDDPAGEAAGLSKGAYCLVMTHSHELDQALCEALLLHNDFAFLGLIGSATKRRRFVQRLKEKGIGEEQLERLTCPIGIPGIESKEPGVIAVSVAAQLLGILSADDAPLPKACRGMDLRR